MKTNEMTKRSILLLLCVLVANNFLLSQHVPVYHENTRQVLDALSQQLHKEYLQRRAIAEEKARVLGIPFRIEHEDGSISQIEYFEGDLPVYVTTYNLVAAISTATRPLHKGQSSGYELSGNGLVIGEWDGGAVRLTHVEFGDRATQRDASTNISNHATHVAGTLIASGVRPDAVGMAPEAFLWAHDWDNDSGEMAAAASSGLLVSNHSYGSIAGWANGDWSVPGTNQWHWWGDVNISETEDYKFGYYDQRAREWDQITYNAPYYLIVKSAGNDRNNVGALNHKVRINGQWVESNTFRPRDGGELGYDCIPTYGNAKNILTIGAVADLPNGYQGPSSVAMSNFSSFGPTDDGRIKPDLVGNGVGLLSSTSAGDNTYGSLSGTSMSGPNVAGSLLLLQELYYRYYGHFMLSSTLKGLAIQTADEAGSTPGPDYRFGWGLLNTSKAADLIHDRGVYQTIIEGTLLNRDTFTLPIYVNKDEPVKITLCWTDPPAQVHPPALNDRRLKLINDLDMRLISSDNDSIIFYPYLLDPENPAAAAIQADNFRDNVEQIDAGIIPPGIYLVQITHKENLFNGKQDFSLISNTPTTPCQLGIAQTINIQLRCDQSTIDRIEVNPFPELTDLEYSLDGILFSSENIFYNLPLGAYKILVRDTNGCVGIQRISIREEEEPIRINYIDSPVFRSLDQSGLSSDLPFSSAFNSGWGTNFLDKDVRKLQAVFAKDGSSNSTLGCEELINAEELRGKIAVFDRGNCEFSAKALRAQNAGAQACIIINNTTGLVQMAPGSAGNQIRIPVLMITQADGNSLRDQILNGQIYFELGINRAIKPATCNEENDGFLRPTLNRDDLENLTILWSNGTTTIENNRLSPGLYTLTITTDNNCTYLFETEVGIMPNPDIQFIVQSETCPDTNDGSIEITPFQDLEDFTFKINDTIFHTPIISGLQPGIYRITLESNINSCQYEYDLVIEEGQPADPGQILGESSVISELIYDYQVNQINNATYFWEIIGGEILSGQNTHRITATFHSISNASIFVKTENGLCSSTQFLEIEVGTSNTIAQQEVYFKLYPSPTIDLLVLEATSPVEAIKIDIIDLINRPVYSERIQLNTLSTRIDVSHLLPGIYIALVNTGAKTHQFKFIKI